MDERTSGAYSEKGKTYYIRRLFINSDVDIFNSDGNYRDTKWERKLGVRLVVTPGLNRNPFRWQNGFSPSREWRNTSFSQMSLLRYIATV